MEVTEEVTPWVGSVSFGGIFVGSCAGICVGCATVAGGAEQHSALHQLDAHWE